jgi:hypothetical protein
MFELCYIYRGLIRYKEAVILSCILMTRHEHTLHLSCFISRPAFLLASNRASAVPIMVSAFALYITIVSIEKEWCFFIPATMRLWLVSHSAPLKARTSTIFKCHLFIYQEAINLIVLFPIRRSPSLFINVSMWEHSTLDRFFDVAKFTTLTPLSSLISYKLPFQIVDLKMYYESRSSGLWCSIVLQ